MTAGDCFELGRILYKESSYDNIKYAREFLVEAYRKYNENEMYYPFNEVDIIEYISMACSKMGDIESALHWTKVILEIDPEHSQAMEIIAYFQRTLATEKKLIESGGQVNSDEEQVNFTVLQATYKALCRGNMDIPAEVSNRLTCHYISKNHPFLKIAPFKVEMMYLNPDIVFFHDVLSNDEIEAIKKMASLKFTRITEQSFTASDQTFSYDHERNISVWFHDAESDTIARVSRRVTHMTGLNVGTVQNLNIFKYGFGEDYIPHYDFNNMSNVALGGATVFPALGLSVFPTKGGAVFWLNVHTSGEGDFATLHADCPIVHGSKWGIYIFNFHWFSNKLKHKIVLNLNVGL
ncbi:unnamed protein product [Arctia plantaginis]|uniref:Prolyl 4-hydroxylase alpha subunit domain-containing protein n=1 Tax=Arctia plantaginis TaxID=874455 RepID=A0A8S0YU42_ARCPL|nr:unnamed protein product [Arctia plantaginis]